MQDMHKGQQPGRSVLVPVGPEDVNIDCLHECLNISFKLWQGLIHIPASDNKLVENVARVLGNLGVNLTAKLEAHKKRASSNDSDVQVISNLCWVSHMNQ